MRESIACSDTFQLTYPTWQAKARAGAAKDAEAAGAEVALECAASTQRAHGPTSCERVRSINYIHSSQHHHQFFLLMDEHNNL